MFVTITAVNNAPVVTLPGASVVYDAAGTTPIILDAAATVTDVDSVNFDTGILTANVTTACDTADRLSVRNEGTGVGQIGVSGAAVTYNPGSGAVTIGTIATEFDCATPPPLLAITLTANADVTATQALVRNLTYSSTSLTPPTTQRTSDACRGGPDNGPMRAADDAERQR